jgi:hypothetical protein
MRSMFSIAHALLAATAAAAATTAGRIYGAENIERHIQRFGRRADHAFKARCSIATGNRHGGPHLHQREIARRLRQEARA